MENISIQTYLDSKGVIYREIGNELITHCLFHECDTDSKGNEAHLYFNKETSQYHCKKCGEEGNLFTLAKYFGDTISPPSIKQAMPVSEKKKKIPTKQITAQMVDAYHLSLPDSIRSYLNARHISNTVIDSYKLGYGSFYGKHWILIPIKDKEGKYIFFKLRQDPNEGDEKMTYPRGIEAQLFDWSILPTAEKLVICEGEMDMLLLTSLGIPAVSSTHGALTFKDEWINAIPTKAAIYVCYDHDDAGKKGSSRVLATLKEYGYKNLYNIILPDEVGEHGDITDYFVKAIGTKEELFTRYANVYPKHIDISQFEEMGIEDIQKALINIKNDNTNKVITFLGALSAFAGDGQFNIIYSAPSSTGKSYIPLEIAKLFSQEDVLEIGYASATAFFHDATLIDKEANLYLYDLSHKVLIFMDQLDNFLLTKLRPILSHDKKEIMVKITDKTQRLGHRTKNITLRGYPAVIFCTANLRTDEQEITRAILLSPEISDEKIRNSMHETITKETNIKDYEDVLESIPERKSLKLRLEAIKNANITQINLSDEARKAIDAYFFNKGTKLKPSSQRDVKWFIYLVKSFTLLNFWWRKEEDTSIKAQISDVEAVITLWESIALSRELHIQPYILSLYNTVFLPLWMQKNTDENGRIGITRQEVLKYYYTLNKTQLDGYKLRTEIIPMLETAGLITEEQDPTNRTRNLIFLPLVTNQYSVNERGVQSSSREEVMSMS